MRQTIVSGLEEPGRRFPDHLVTPKVKDTLLVFAADCHVSFDAGDGVAEPERENYIVE